MWFCTQQWYFWAQNEWRGINVLLRGWAAKNGRASPRGKDSPKQIAESWALPSRHKQHWFKLQVWVKWWAKHFEKLAECCVHNCYPGTVSRCRRLTGLRSVWTKKKKISQKKKVEAQEGIHEQSPGLSAQRPGWFSFLADLGTLFPYSPSVPSCWLLVKIHTAI